MATVTAVPNPLSVSSWVVAWPASSSPFQMAKREADAHSSSRLDPDRGAEHYRWALHGAAATSTGSIRHRTNPSTAIRSKRRKLRRPPGLRRRLGGRSLSLHAVTLLLKDWALDEQWPESVVRDLTKNGRR